MAPNERPRPEPSQRGSLGRTPLAHLLVYAQDRGLTGTFDLTTGGQRSSIAIVGGKPVKVRVHVPAPYLGRVLLEMGRITPEQLDQTLVELAETRRLHGQILIDRGFITHVDLIEGLREQMRHRLDAMFDFEPETLFEYFADYNGLSDYGGPEEVPLDPFALVWRGVCRRPSWEHVQETLSHLNAARVRLSRTANIDRFDLGRAERRLVEVMRAKPMMPHELASTNLLPPKLVQLLLYVFAITKQISLLAPDAAADDSASFPSMDLPPPSSSSLKAAPPTEPPPSPSPSSAQVARVSLRKSLSRSGRFAAVQEVRSAPRDARSATEPPPAAEAGAAPVFSVPAAPALPVVPVPTAASIAARRKEILDRAAAVEKEDYFAMLGVPREADTTAARTAYFDLARKWHPDKLPAELADVKTACATVFAKLTEAHQVLTDAKQRARYLNQLAEGAVSADDQAKVEVVLDAAMSFQKAEVCFKRHDFAQAEALCRHAVEADATQADYFAMLAWLEALKPVSQSKEATLARIRELDHALALSDRCERAYFYRAQLHKRAGDDRAALADFKKARDLNPRNLDAQTEVRLLERRKGSERQDKGGGLLSRFFGKK